MKAEWEAAWVHGGYPWHLPNKRDFSRDPSEQHAARSPVCLSTLEVRLREEQGLKHPTGRICGTPGDLSKQGRQRPEEGAELEAGPQLGQGQAEVDPGTLFLICLFVAFVFETLSHCGALAACLFPAFLLPQPPECMDYRHVPPRQQSLGFF